METGAISVLELNRRLSDAIAQTPDVRNVWVKGETSDVRTAAGGHCYLELVEKGEDGRNVSRIRANVWANTFASLRHKFRNVTGCDFASGMKVLVCVTASYHPSYGMSVTVTDIDPAFTAGDAMRRRAEILERLTREGILENNRQVKWSLVPGRVAVISAHGAAGYGDFITHLFSNPGRFRFSVDLFPAVMQGERTVSTVLEAFASIGRNIEKYDAVVLIRGGGSTTDLAAFDNYELAAAIAKFPLPVIVGIGHERDVTVLDYVANLRVKTPTAAAESLIERVGRVYDALGRAADRIYTLVSERIASNRELLAHASASIPGFARQAVMRHAARLERDALTMAGNVSNAVSTRRERLRFMSADIAGATRRTIERNGERLERAGDLLKVLSPDAVLARGFSLTLLPDGKVLRNKADAVEGTVITTRLQDGSIESLITKN